jgi:hypothetical protein
MFEPGGIELDFDHESAMKVPLGEVSDEQLLAEVGVATV